MVPRLVSSGMCMDWMMTDDDDDDDHDHDHDDDDDDDDEFDDECLLRRCELNLNLELCMFHELWMMNWMNSWWIMPD